MMTCVGLACVLGVFILWLILSILSVISYGGRWAVLVPKDQRPEILNKPHNDWFILKFVPRSLTAFISDRGPIKLLGSVSGDDYLDVPKRGWALTFPLGLSLTTYSGWHFRIPGFRFDYVDRYYNLTATVKKLRR